MVVNSPQAVSIKRTVMNLKSRGGLRQSRSFRQGYTKFWSMQRNLHGIRANGEHTSRKGKHISNKQEIHGPRAKFANEVDRKGHRSLCSWLPPLPTTAHLCHPKSTLLTPARPMKPVSTAVPPGSSSSSPPLQDGA